MKFGSNLPRNQVPEWSSEYINYKGLKKLIKSAAAEQELHGNEADLAEYFYSLDRNLETVDAFFNKRSTETQRRLRLLKTKYGNGTYFQYGGAKEEIEDIIAVLLELRSQLRKLQWYGEVNRRGFVKILKKLDKRVPGSNAQQKYLQTRVDPRPFAGNNQLTDDMNLVNLWLSRLSEMKAADDDSDESTGSLSRTTSNSMMNVPKEIIGEIDFCVKEDRVSDLENALDSMQSSENADNVPSQQFLLHVLQRAIYCNSKHCIEPLLKRVDSLEEDDDINRRNCLHRLVITLGRTVAMHNAQEDISKDASSSIAPATAPQVQAPYLSVNEVQISSMLEKTDVSVKLLEFILDHLSATQQCALNARDSLGRLPLHYAAQFGFLALCQVIIDRMHKWRQLGESCSIDAPELFDEDGNSPLHLSIMGGNLKTTKFLLESAANGSSVKISSLLIVATKSNYFRLIRLLLDAGANPNFQDELGETALHVAARLGHVDCARELISSETDLNVCEITFGWTPLATAAVVGQLEMAKHLVEAGADVKKPDTSGWTAQEHAALRGHIPIARVIAAQTSAVTTSNLNGSANVAPSTGEKTSVANSRDNGSVRKSAPVKSFGHRYLKDESLVLVSLGSMDPRKEEKPVILDNIPLAEAHATQLDTALSVVVSCTGANGEPTVIDLPVQENISTEPISFTTKDVSKVKVLFDIVPTYAGSKDKVIGRGIAQLSSVKQNIGSKRMNLQGDISVPIVAAKTLDYIGAVNFNFIVITPFEHSNMAINKAQTYWKSLSAPTVIGHRGMGKNMASRKSLQLGENTMQSFIAAANLGASYVEFDVQLTKDHVPVIYHDFLVSETGIDAPVHTLTLEQFMHVNETASSSHPLRGHNPVAQEPGVAPGDDRAAAPRQRPHRAHSMDSKHAPHTSGMPERMKFTRDFQLKGFKGNSRGHFIQAPFTTLEEMLRKLPQSIGFNIEMKYPMLWECEDQEMDTYAVELNSFIDTVLRMVYDLGKDRSILFSSFNPDVCLLLSFKQPSIPVMFLTDAGASAVGDVRAGSLQEAIRFASRWNLLGIVTAAEALVLCPRLVRVVKESGLVCVSYGVLNNEPSKVKLQVNEGIDAVIVDSVLAIRQGLTQQDKANDKSEEISTNGTVNPPAAPDSAVAEGGGAVTPQTANGAASGQ